MRIVPLTPTPSQSFTATLENIRWEIRIFSIFSSMACDVKKNGEELLKGSKILSGETLIPYGYLQKGNFIFLSPNEEIPNFLNFGTSQFLFYLSTSEIVKLSTSPLSVGDLTVFTPSFLTTDDGFYITTDDGGILTDD